MKMELTVAHDFPLFGTMRETGAVLGAFDMPDCAKAELDTVGQKLRNAIAGGHLVFVQPGKPEKAAKAKKGDDK